MQVTANPRGRRIVDKLLACQAVEKRRSLGSDECPGTDCIPSKTAPPVSPITSDKPSEAEAIRRAQSGDPLMFEHLYRLHNRRVHALCLRMVGNTTEAEDLTQEAFLLLLRKIHTFRGESAFSTWLHRLAANLVLMRLRKKSPPVISIEANPDPDENAGLPTIDVGVPDLLLEGSIDRINLERCIKQLPTGYRTMFVLHDIQGYRHNEIAEIVGRSVGVSKSQLHKARMRLRELLHEFRRERARDERLTAVKLRSRSRELCSSSTHSPRHINRRRTRSGTPSTLRRMFCTGETVDS
jgi:RNA polymerase sigma-70 factor, ECF subfamily